MPSPRRRSIVGWPRHVTVKAGGNERATRLYGGVTSPNLVVVESEEMRSCLMQAWKRWQWSASPAPRSSSSAAPNDVGLYKKLLDAGRQRLPRHAARAMDFVAAVHRCFRDSTEEAGPHRCIRRREGRTGSSTLAHNVAYACPSGWMRCSSGRFRSSVRDARPDFDIEAKQGMVDVLQSPERSTMCCCGGWGELYGSPSSASAITDLDKFITSREEDVDHLLDVAR